MNLLSEHIRFARSMRSNIPGLEQNGRALDMQGFDGILALFFVRDIDAGENVTCLLQHSDTFAESFETGDFEDVEGSGSVAVVGALNDNLRAVMIDLFRPSRRYIRPRVVRSVVDNSVSQIWTMQYSASTLKTSHDTIDDPLDPSDHGVVELVQLVGSKTGTP